MGYTVEDFAGAKDKECDLVMKGGVTSGVVYPYALLELAKVYRFRSIGGASAGGIAAAFAAAAEYSRTAQKDPGGFVRLEAHCEVLREHLADLFQPDQKFSPLMRYLLRAQEAGGLAFFTMLPAFFWGSALAGMAAGGLLMAALQADVAGILLGAAVGLAAALALRLGKMLGKDLPAAGFGLCSGLTQPGARTAALTDWLHAALQDIAFGDAKREAPLTFGDLARATPTIDLKMMTTNLSMRRPHTLPDVNLEMAFDPKDWDDLFPGDVMAYLRATSTAADGGRLNVPVSAQLPVLVAVRMSLSFPLLFKAIPMWTKDYEFMRIVTATGGRVVREDSKVWFTDGGISSNFPIHLFDALLPRRPTFALSLDDLPEGAIAYRDGKPTPRVVFAKTASDGANVPVHAIESLVLSPADFWAAKDWQDQLLSVMPGQRERIARIYLNPQAEGGLNLTMGRERADQLMAYGREVGAAFAKGALDFDDHRWRRTLSVYQQLQTTLSGFGPVWQGEYAAWYADYSKAPTYYKATTSADREAIGRSLDAIAKASEEAFREPVRQTKKSKFPRPPGRLRIVPEA